MLMVTSLQALEKDKIIIEKSYAVEEGNWALIVDNLYGDVKIESYDGDEVKLHLEIVVWASSERLIMKAKEELSLRDNTVGEKLILSMKAPFVQEEWRNGEVVGRRIYDDPEYDYNYNYSLLVPTSMSVKGRTVNEGEVIIKGAFADIEASNVNGSVLVQDARKVSKAHTVNGSVDVFFTQNPDDDGSFHTINGNITLYMQPEPSMEVSAETMHGEMFSSFEFEQLPPRVLVNTSQKKNSTLYKLEEKLLAKIGDGGPHLQFETLNGNIYIKKI